MNISNLLARNARKFSKREALIDGNERLTFRELNGKVNQLASSLRSLGVEKGSKVILFMPNTKEFVYSYFAIQRLGGIVVPVNAKLGTGELRYIIDHSDAMMVIVHQVLLEAVYPLTNEKDVVWIKTGESLENWRSLEVLIENGEQAEFNCHLSEDDESTMLYTSGTTGNPKGVVFTNRNILTVAVMMCIETKMNDDSVILHMMPLSHSAPLHLFFVAGMYVGAKHVVSPMFTPDALLKIVATEKITHFFGAPVAYLLTAKQPNINEYDLSSVQFWVYGGAPLSVNEVKFVQQALRTNQLMCVYGLTEAGPSGTFLGPIDHGHKAGSIGNRAALNCEIKIVDENGNEVSYGTIGEIILSGEGNMKGYYKDDEGTTQTLKNGWLFTGDMAKMDEDGYIWIVDRKKDMIISGGVNIYPKEVEDILRTHPSIADVAIVGVPHSEWGESSKAYIVLGEEIENVADECKRFLNGKVAKFKQPRLYEVIVELPRNATGKILKQILRKKGEENEIIQG